MTNNISYGATNNLDFEDWKSDLEEQFHGLPKNELISKMYEINGENLRITYDFDDS